MFKILKFAVAVLALAAAPITVVAQPINIQVTTDPLVNFNSLIFGQTFTAYINVIGVPAEGLTYFSTALTFDSAILSASPAIAGPIAPDDPLDDFDFLDASGPGEAAVSYLSFTAPISADGVFFSVTFQALANGAGGAALNPLATFAIDGEDISYDAVSGSGLSLSLDVPEPASLSVFAISFLMLSRRRHLRRQSQ